MDRPTALATPLRDLAGWRLLIHCARCREVRELMIATMRADQHRTVGDALDRLRCGKCRTQPRWVKLSDGRLGTAREVIEVALIEP